MSDKLVELQELIKNNDVVVFMKGTGKTPMCGFSSTVAQIFDKLGVTYKDINIFENVELARTLKTFTDWPTFPQVFVKGEMIGGCDITREMYQAGELQQLLSEKNIPHAA